MTNESGRREAGPAAHRAYSILDIKSFSEDGDLRVIEGIASTPETDRMGDIVEPLGAKFALPMPLLWQHRADQPVGTVEFAGPTENGIPFRARIARISEPGELKNTVDKAWQAVKAGLVRAVSIGFRVLPDGYEVMKDGGWRIKKWEWLELSLVTIPANSGAIIQTVKSLDEPLLAASGRNQGAVPASPAGVTATVKSTNRKTGIMAQTISEQIASFGDTLKAKNARIEALLAGAAERGSTLDDAESDEYDTAKAEAASIEKHLARLREQEDRNRTAAVDVSRASTEHTAKAVRDGVVPRVQYMGQNVPKGLAFTRYAIALGRAKGNMMQAERIASSIKEWASETPEVAMSIKAAVEAGTTTGTTWAEPLVQYTNMASEFAEYLRPLTIVGRIEGLRRVPFNVKVPRQTGGATVDWVGESSVKPLTSLAFDSITLGHAKVAGIIPLSDELIRFSSPSAEMIVRNDLAAAIAAFLDVEFIDPTNAAVTNVSPAAITYGATSVTATGTTAATLRADINTLMATFLTNNLNPANAFWVMTQRQALAISLMVNSLGQPQFPGIGMNGGTLVGLPVIVSESVPSVGSSPTDGGRIVLAIASEILVADDGQVTIDVSNEASLQMDTSPDSPTTASTVLVSLWQRNMTAFRAERFINWTLRRSTAVAYINYAKYAE